MENFYNERAGRFNQSYERSKNLANRWSWLRGGLFISTVTLFILYFNSGIPAQVILACIVALLFYIAVIRHRNAQEKAHYYATIATLNQNEINRKKLQFTDFGTGAEYFEKDHPYQHDLDVFGENSIYQLINRCEIKDSETTLAKWLSSPATVEDIRSRQGAVKELTENLDWCQDFTTRCRISMSKKQKHDPAVSCEDIIRWVRSPLSLAKPKFLKVIAITLNLATLIIATLIIAAFLPYQALYGPLVINAIFLGFVIKNLNRIVKGIDKSYYLISTYHTALECIEKQHFTSNRLQQLQKKLFHGKRSSTRAIQSLASLTHRINARANMLYGIADLLLVLDTYLYTDLFNWKKKYRDETEEWLKTIHEVECLVSLAGFSKLNPHYCFPDVNASDFSFKAKELGHPLITPAEKVTNDYAISGKGSVDIITGSNMSGKSTFQRTIGVNMVLAQMGAPVAARELKMGRTSIFTSMRTRDNLAENTSSFYAELKRIRLLLDLLSEDTPAFFLLDEILKGTNSEDRHKGAVALARKLTRQPAFGLISTHDLALGQLAMEESAMRNFSFNSEIEENKIQFDYRLSPGVCTSFNASKLMENMGIL